jgi:uncharacterized membrane protein (DUF4010 family)
MFPDELSPVVATLAILLAITSNALFKIGACWWLGTAGLALRVAVPLLAACTAGLGFVWFAGQSPAVAGVWPAPGGG